jgi:hypothetical protein
MLAKSIRSLFGPAVVLGLACGCDTAEPGAGFTNGPPPMVQPENPAVRTDLPPPAITDADVTAGEASAQPSEGASGAGAKESGGSTEPVKPTPDPSGTAPKSP